MQFIDLKTQYQQQKEKILARIQNVLEHGQYIMGPEIQELEEKLAKFTNTKYCIAVSSGTDALLLALMALEVKPGDEIITTPFSFMATAEVIELLGAKTVFVDINPNTYNLDPELLSKAITKRTKAIMPVSLYGQCANFKLINEIANEYGIPVIEDAAQSFGATHHKQFSCGLSSIGATSFFPSKPLGCYGDGGACFTNDDEIADRIRILRVHGQAKRYYHTKIGINGRLDTLQAAILLAKLESFAEEIRKRDELGRYYTQKLKAIAKTQFIEPNNTSVYAQFTIEVNNRESFCEYLKNKGIPTAVHYPIPLHQQPALKAYLQTSCPIAENAAKRVVSLPMHPFLTFDEIDKITQICNTAMDLSR